MQMLRLEIAGEVRLRTTSVFRSSSTATASLWSPTGAIAGSADIVGDMNASPGTNSGANCAYDAEIHLLRSLLLGEPGATESMQNELGYPVDIKFAILMGIPPGDQMLTCTIPKSNQKRLFKLRNHF